MKISRQYKFKLKHKNVMNIHWPKRNIQIPENSKCLV